MRCSFFLKILQAVDILQPPSQVDLFNEVYVINSEKIVGYLFFLLKSFRYILTELMQIDLHKIIVSQQPLSIDHCKVFLYQILRGN